MSNPFKIYFAPVFFLGFLIVLGSAAPSALAQRTSPRTDADFALAYNLLPAGTDFTLTLNDQNFTASPETVASWNGISSINEFPQLLRPVWSTEDLASAFLGPQTLGKDRLVYYHFKVNKIFSYVKSLATKIDSEAVEPQLVMEQGRATAFTPPQDGQKVDLAQTTKDALQALEHGQNFSAITVNETQPNSSLSELNNLGIKELVSWGESNFSGSPQNRRHNIAVGVEKMKGIIIQQGEEFSFNKYLGPVDGEHGFLPELVIKKTGTVPEFGGGLCQVSSTTFRAAMSAGLPITQRKNHAYAVQYYAPQGTDATIYPGVVDLKFINDTPGAILVWPYLKDKNTLIFDFYGTKDDRQVTLEKPVQWDRKPDGSMKASWTRIVVKDGETSSSTFKSIYQPPALFHKEETFVKSTSTPATPATPAAN